MVIPSQDDIGRAVVYMRGDPPFDEGVITSFNDHFVFVRYGKDWHSKATHRSDLQWVHRVPARLRGAGVEESKETK
jgi:hypothetical protein